MELLKAINSVLRNDSEIQAIVNGSVSMAQRPQDSDIPAIVYAVVELRPEQFKELNGSKSIKDRAVIQIMVYDQKPRWDLFDLVRNALTGMNPAAGTNSKNINGVEVQSADFEFATSDFGSDSELYVIEGTFNFCFKP